MAASMLCRRTAALCQNLNGAVTSKSLLLVNSKCEAFAGLVLTAAYNPKPLRLKIHGAYIPDKNDPKTPEWQRTAKYDAKVYGRYGSASGVDPASLWPSPKKLEEIIEEERQWHPTLEVMLKNIAEREAEETAKRLEREKLIATNMAKMAKMTADWRREKQEARLKVKEQKARKAMLLAEARDRFGFAVDPRSRKFLDMVAEIEKEEKKKKKLQKRKLREGQIAMPDPPTAATAARS